ncbi:MAG: ice-binding family protein [Bacteroidota bacterium]
MNKSIIQSRSLIQLTLRAVVMASISFSLLLLAACEVNTPSGQGEPNALASPQGFSGSLSLTSAVDLGTASTFAVLGGTTVTNDGPSLINGDLGVFPGTEITGFDLTQNTISGPGTVTGGLGIVNGTIYAGGPVAEAAHIDAGLAYNYLVAQTPDVIYAGDGYQLDGMTFTPGVYKFDPSANLQVNGTVTLDFQGNSEALFIFQMGTTLVTMHDSKVIAINTGNPDCLGANVYWAVGSSATIDGAEFVGTVIAHTTITMTSAANLSGTSNVSGRMLALGGEVTMVTQNISVCGSGVIPPPDPPKPCRDFVTGGGWIGNKATFGVSGGIKNGKFWGQLSFNDHKGMRVKSTEVTAYIYIDAVTRQIEGIAKINGKGSFPYTVVVSDNGEPGRNDSFSLEISDYSISGNLKGGNIQIHKKCEDDKDGKDGKGGKDGKDGKDGKHGKDKDGKAGKDDDDREDYDDKDERDGHRNCDND